MNLFRGGLSLLAAGWLCAAGAASPTPLAVTPNGSLKIDELTLSITNYQLKTWRAFSQESKYFEVKDRSGKSADYRMNGIFKMPDLPEATLAVMLKQESATQWKYRAEIGFSETAELAQIGLSTSMPIEKFCGRELLIDGKKVVLPLEYKEGASHMISSAKVKSEMVIPTLDSRITFRGQFEIVLQDNRAFKGNTYTLRLLCTPPRGKLSSAALDLTILVEPYRSAPLDLAGVVNMGFADEKDGDQKGGWTDQGSENDLRMIPTGKQRWAGIDFEIIDPAKNNGKSCLLLAGLARGYFPKEVTAVQTKPVQGNYLYLLHALAWPVEQQAIGTVIVTYADGSRSRIPVTGGVDVGNWWGATSRKNGEVVWTGENKSAYVGLFRSVYPIEAKPIKSITFQSAGISVWGVVAASVSPDRVPRLMTTPAYIIEGKDWKPIVYHKDFEKGSVLDFSGRLDAPAGKYGPLVVKGDKLVFRDRPDVPVRFYGTNFCGTGQYQTKEWAERLADRIAALGYNAVRFHHHDNGLALHKDGRSTELNPVTLDQLDYLIACFKKRGIYYTTDLYVSRRIEKGEFPEYPDQVFVNKTYKPMVFVLDSAMENWKAFAKNWLTHVNPYTGLALKDDPALLSLSLINEDNISSCWNATPESAKLFMDRFEEWKKARGVKERSVVDAGMDVLFAQFLVDTYNQGFAEMKSFVRGLGVKAIISDQNMSTNQLLALMRAQYDYVDNHFYWDHPSFPETRWQLPSAASNESAIAKEANAPGRISPTRLLDKPMMITEFDYAKPNFFRAEGAVLTGAYAALQDWDALFQFAYAHSREKVTRDNITEGHFDTSTDVVKSLAQRIGVRLFLDRELKPAPVTFAAVLTGGEGMSFAREYSAEINRLGLIARIGTLVAPDGKLDALPANTAGLLNLGINVPEKVTLPVFQASSTDSDLLAKMTAAGVLKPEWYQADKGLFNASSGQIVLDSQKETFKAVAPSCEALILPAKMQGEGAFMKVDNKVGRGVFSVMSVDGNELVKSGRMLLLHLTDSQASKIKFNSKKMTQMDQWGSTPFLAARGEAEIELAAAPGEYTLYAADTAGKRLMEIPVKRTASGKLRFPVNVFTEKGPVFVYELVRK